MELMKKVTKIDEKVPFKRKIRVAAYCRVSTDSDEQRLSLETQKTHYEKYIKSNNNWEYAGLFYDLGITGTKAECRNGLMALVKACEQGKVDLVLTKSISRFSRNTTDCIELVRKFLDLKVTIIFEKENINTGTMESELMLSILSSLAENESVSISENNKWSVQKRFQDGTYIVSCPPYGYKNIDGKMVIEPEQAEIVKRIFADILSGQSAYAIAKELNKEGIASKRKGKWAVGTITGIIRNEKYIGDALFQKTYTDSQFNRHKNNGELSKYNCHSHHQPIVSQEVFQKANAILNQHGKEKGNDGNTERYKNRYGFSGKIRCGECGGVFKRRIHQKPSGDYIAWCCTRHIQDKNLCSMKYVTDDGIKVAFINMMNKLIFSHKFLLKPLLNTLQGSDENKRLLKLKEYEDKLEKNKTRRQVLEELISSGILDQEIVKSQTKTLDEEEQHLEEEIKGLKCFVSDNSTKIDALKKLIRFVSKNEMLTEYDDELFTAFVSGAIILSREEIVFELKCGLNLKERLEK